MMKKIRVELDKLSSNIKQTIVACLKATGLQDIPNVFTVVKSVNTHCSWDPEFYYIELPNGLKYGTDYDDLGQWNCYDVLYANWTYEFKRETEKTEEPGGREGKEKTAAGFDSEKSPVSPAGK